VEQEIRHAMIGGIMVMTVIDDPIPARFRGAVAEVHGDRIEHLVLYGSRARGDARIPKPSRCVNWWKESLPSPNKEIPARPGVACGGGVIKRGTVLGFGDFTSKQPKNVLNDGSGPVYRRMKRPVWDG
jgi:hypothetical protein